MFSKDNSLNWEYWHSRIHIGQHDLSLLSRRIIYNIRPDLFELLPFEDDFTFLEPLLFSAFASPTPAVDIESIVVGYFRGDYSPFAFTVKSNADGVVVIPAIGSHEVATESIRLLAVNAGGKQQIVSVGLMGNDNLSFVVEPKTSIHNFSVCSDIHYLLYPLFKFADGTVGSIPCTHMTGVKYLPLLERGLKHISIAYPDYFAALTSVTRGFLVFRQPGMNSFASDSAHGISFLSVPDYVSIPYFVEDIAHQCGHIVFSAMFFRREDLMDVALDLPISQYNQNPDDNRSIYVVFHALFTEHVIATCLLSLFETVERGGEECDEVIGRLAFIMKKYHRDLESLGEVTPRTENGDMIYNELEESYKDLYSKCGHQIKSASLTGQPYNFDFRRYMEANRGSSVGA